MATRNVDLTEHFDKFVDQQVEAGHYQNVSEVLLAGLRLLEIEQHKLSLLIKLAAQGFEEIDQGRGLVLSNETELANFVNGIGRRAAKTASSKSSV
jgi:antitoxin ParD1/3/4